MLLNKGNKRFWLPKNNAHLEKTNDATTITKKKKSSSCAIYLLVGVVFKSKK